MFDKVRGPYEKWEVKLFASKYRDFFVLSDTGQWVAYKKWNGVMNAVIKDVDNLFVDDKPSGLSMFFSELKRYIKRNVFKDHH